MTRGGLSALVRMHLAGDVRGAVSSVFGIAVGVASLVFFVALGLGLNTVLRERIFPVDSTLVEVVPSQLSFGPLGTGKLDDAMVARLRALPGVADAWRKMNVRPPAVTIYSGDFFGRPLRMGLEILAVGVDPGLVGADVKPEVFRDQGEGQPIPAVAAARLIEIYNVSFAPARGLPRLSGAMLTGFTFPVDFNRSFVATSPAGPVLSERAQVVGVSERGLLAGITIPLDVAARLNRKAGVDAETYSAVTLRAEDPSAVPALVAAVKDMGFGVDDHERRMAENIGAAVALATGALALLSALVCLLAAFNVAHALSAAVRARTSEFAILRAVGASARDVVAVVVAQAAVVGHVGGVVGVLCAFAGASLLDVAVAHALPAFPFKPATCFLWPGWLLAGGWSLGLVAAMGGALGPALRVARLDAAAALGGPGVG